MDYSDMARVLAPALSVYFHAFDTTHDLGRGTAFPLTAEVRGGVLAGDRFFRTDLGVACYYDGTRWLTVQTFEARFPRTTYSATTSDITTLQILPQTYAPYVVRQDTLCIIGATNTGANYWTIQVQASLVGAISVATNASAPGSSPILSNTVAAQPSGVQAYWNLAMVKTGAPSNIDVATVLTYRYVIT